MQWAAIAQKGGATASGLLSAKQQSASGKLSQIESETMARQTELAATARESDRKSRLAKALASQNAMAGAKGIAAFEGSPLTILEADIKAEEVATERDIFQSELEAMTQRSKGNIARKSAQAQSLLTIHDAFKP